MGWPAVMPDMIQWPMVGQPNNASALADAYGATHGQPQSGMAGLDWFNSANAAIMADMSQSPFGMPNGYQQMPSVPANQQFHPAHLTQQLNALHLQNQQNEQIMKQQNKLLAQIQAAQERRALAELEATSALQQQHTNNPVTQFAQIHHIPHDLPSNPRHAIAPRPKQAQGQHSDRSRSPGSVLDSRSPGDRRSGASSPFGTAHGSQLPPEVSKAMSIMNALRQQSNDSHSESSDSSFNRSPRPNSYTFRDRNRDNGSWAQGNRSESRHVSNLPRNEKYFNPETPERNRASTPSIVIDQSSVENPTLPPLPNPADANAVGMRIGQRIVPGISDTSLPRHPDTQYADNLPSTPNNRPDKRQSYSELSAGKPGQARYSEPINSRPTSSPASSHTTLIQPRRQPRGPPMESFFANNFLARRSLRTRREAMSKLCASPRAASFSGAQNHSQSVPSLARQV